MLLTWNCRRVSYLVFGITHIYSQKSIAHKICHQRTKRLKDACGQFCHFDHQTSPSCNYLPRYPWTKQVESMKHSRPFCPPGQTWAETTLQSQTTLKVLRTRTTVTSPQHWFDGLLASSHPLSPSRAHVCTLHSRTSYLGR